MLLVIGSILLAYLLGSLSFAVLMSRLFGLADPRTYGSGNPGATNVLRSGKKWAAALTLFGDAAKGWLPVYLIIQFAPHSSLGAWWVASILLAVFLGHVFPVFLRFKGGKGVATALGVLLAVQVWLGLAVLATWLLVALLSRYSSLAALTAASAAPVYCMFFHLRPELVLACALMALLLIVRHKSNIINLMTGKESKIGRKQTA